MKITQKLINRTLIALGILIITPLFYLALRGKIFLPNSIEIASFNVNFYGLIIGIGVITVFYFVEKHIEKNHFEVIINWLPLLAFTTVAGARIWHLLTDYQKYNSIQEMIQIWNGGLGIYGAVIGGGLTLWLIMKWKKMPILKIFETIAVFLPLGQIIGRLGNFLNQELYGYPTNLPWGTYIRQENRIPEFIGDKFFHPTFLYEMIGNTILFIILYKLFKKRGIKSDGFFLVLYLGGYSVVRFLVEFVRLEPDVFWILSFNQIMSLIFAIGCFGYLGLIKKINKTK